MSRPSGDTSSPGARWFAGLAGLILGAALLKFGNPVIFGPAWLETTQTSAGSGLIEWTLGPWPIHWAYWALFVLALSTFFTPWTWRSCTSSWLIVLPLLWLVWQLVASVRTIRPDLSGPILRHFFTCCVWFYLGVFGMGAVRRPGLFLGLLTLSFTVVMAVGWEQHWGGLEDTRRYFYQLPNWNEFPPAFLTKLASNRIYATLFYPNTLAGAILLFLPVTLAWIWEWTRSWEFKARLLLTGLLAGASLACLYWSQSKAGWLILLGMVGVVFLHLPLARRLKVLVAGLLVVVGLGAFFLRYSSYFSRGATSLTARFDYWKAAAQGVAANPWLGSGPGTFMVHYAQVKPPEAEMARLAHNDYLQLACDSGLPGAVAFALFVWGGLAWLYRQKSVRQSLLYSAIWLGLLGLSLQSFLEFGLYVPALAWPLFFLFGWLLSKKQSDTLPAA